MNKELDHTSMLTSTIYLILFLNQEFIPSSDMVIFKKMITATLFVSKSDST